jgi:hypothetical protein
LACDGLAIQRPVVVVYMRRVQGIRRPSSPQGARTRTEREPPPPRASRLPVAVATCCCCGLRGLWRALHVAPFVLG